MAWRFKASKYKNAAPIVPKPEACVRDISVGSYQTYGNNIAASAAFMTFNVDHNGSNLAVLPIDDCGRKSKTMPLLHAHTDTVTDMAFSPFNDGLLATGSQDCLVKIWHIPEKGLEESLSQPECIFSHKQRRVETVSFHPTADFLLTSTSFATVSLWDINTETELYSSSEGGDVVQSLSWRADGTVFATTCKDKQVRVQDPRANRVTHSANSHQGLKDSRVVWLGDPNWVLTTGFDAVRLREVYIRDIRNFEEPVKILQLDCSTGILVPLFDLDTNMLFLAGKGDTTIQYMEVTERDPYLIEGLRHSGEQTKGACLVPKRALQVMQAEVNRVLQLTSTSVIPITYQVPRKSYRDYHSDLFPDTAGPVSPIFASQWMAGENRAVAKISLDPAKKQAGITQVHRGNLSQMRANMSQQLQQQKESAPNNKLISAGKYKHEAPPSAKQHQNGADQTAPVPPKPMPRSRGSIPDSMENASDNNGSSVVAPRPAARVAKINATNNGTVTSGNGFVSYSANSAFKPRLGPRPYTPPNLGDKSDAAQETSNGKSADMVERVDKLSLDLDKDIDESGDQGDESGHTPTTAERRRLFEEQTGGQTSKPKNKEAGETKPVVVSEQPSPVEEVAAPIEDSSGDGLSIAERRRLYESRSMSVQEPASLSPTPLRRRDSLKGSQPQQETIREEPRVKVTDKNPELATPTPKRTSTVFGRVSKFRHLKGTFMPKATHIENIRNISQQLPKECDGFHANPVRAAVPLSGPGGKIAIFELDKTGKLPDGVIPTLVNGTSVMDFAWDPFDYSRLAVACDDGTIQLWTVPEGGLTEPTNEPTTVLSGHSEKIYFLKFHPLARDVVATGSFDMTVRIWDLKEQTEKLQLEGHTDQIFSFAWSPCGKFCATMCKDTRLRVFEPRKSSKPIAEGTGTEGLRGARVVWALDGTMLVVAGFDKISERQIVAYNAKNLKAPLGTVGLDVSPAILVPFYDEDSSTIFLTGKGDSTVYVFEVTEESPYLCALSHHRMDSLHQGISFLPKNVCNISGVEFAKALRLTNNTIKPVSYTVPRIKSELFQDDLFPPTRVTWEPTMEAKEWFEGGNKQPRRISLKPEGMDSLSDSQPTNGSDKVSHKIENSTPFVGQKPSWDQGSVKEKQAAIQKSVSKRMEINMKLEQDEMEGVDSKEWED
ncbi:coronin-7 isoform X1 [Cloeon dipterum]|uniref:coronin-7 isoform X1 n=1 Tax=Cloeon dipterum TaxID=197152 RepID=UPI0032202C55